ncbi:MAG: cobaltochelatase subunit CobN [Dissulfurimicrobium sp.]|uniref:cobaltochelatase subunit CobN n=1 Tax=Dissulfurimicrobium sp. TaxID=2022436 RepID=UPI004049B0E5
MKSFTLCYFSAHSIEIPSLSAGVRQYQQGLYTTSGQGMAGQGGKIRVIGRTGRQLFDESHIKAFVSDALASDVVLLVLHGGRQSCPAFDALVKAISEKKARREKVPYLHIYPQGSDEDSILAAQEHDSDFGTDRWTTLNRYLVHGGRINFYNMLCYLHNLLFQDEIPCDPPQSLPEEGIYHPDLPGIPDLEGYLRQKIDSKKLTVGLWFYQSHWLNDNLAYIDAIIREIERQGANVISVFHLRYKDAERGNKGADYIVERFFMDNGKPRIDCLISPMMFSLTLAAPEYKNLLARLNVPFIQAIATLNSYVEWKEGIQGISTMDVTFSAAQPEFDGALITVPVATREEEEIDPFTGALLAKNMPIPERVEKMVSLSLNWARLRKKRNEDKRIAIIFHHYPPRNDRIGCILIRSQDRRYICSMDRYH